MNNAALATEPLRSTEIGDLPGSWEVISLGEALTQAQYGLSVRGQKSGTYPILRMNCQERGRVIFRDLQFVDLDDRTLESYRLNDGDILFNRTNSHELVGRSALFDGSRTAVFASYLLRLATDRSKLLPAFLNFYLASESAQESLKSFATRGVSQSNISASKLRLLRVPLPPIYEQRAIAGVLSKLQAAVELQDRIVATFKELKAATMAKLFREGLLGEPLKQTEIGEIPESWDVVRLDSLIEPVSGGTPSKRRPDWWQGSIPWASPKDMKTTRLLDTEDHISAEALGQGSRLVPAKTIFVVTRGMVLAKDVPVAITEAPMAFNQDMRALLPTGAIDPDFLLYAIIARKNALKPSIGTSAHGTRGLGAPSVEELLVPRPSQEKEQLRIVRALRDLERRVEVAQESTARRRVLFTEMLHLLLTARIRVPTSSGFRPSGQGRATEMSSRMVIEERSGRVSESLLAEIVRRIVEAVAPEKIVLFGSAARGEMRPDSDLDLLVIKSRVHRRATAQAIERSLVRIPLPTDIIVATPEDIARHRDTIGRIYGPALREGRVLYAA